MSLSTFIEEKKREFEKRFVVTAHAKETEHGLLWSIVEDGEFVTPQKIEAFLESSLTQLAEKVFEAVRPEKHEKGGFINFAEGFDTCLFQVKEKFLALLRKLE